VDQDHRVGKQDQILKSTSDIELLYNKRIKPSGVKKVGPSHLKIGNRSGPIQDNGTIVVVNAVVIA
jgi:hypothetical protein